ncbi:unnamed protein product [Caenorhabditis brenneri]
MKLLINCVLICAILTVWVSAKPAPSDRIKLFMEALNKDREEMGVKIGTPIRKLIYDANLEANILDILKSRNDEVLMVLKKNDVAKKTNDNSKITSEAKNLESLYFFAPDAKTIGCSITLTVSDEEETIEYFGGCIFGERVNIEEFKEKLIKAGLPPVSKYADLLGVEPKEGSGAGSVFSLIVYSLMLIYLALSLILIFPAATSDEIRAKRDLSLDVRNKLIEKYDVSLERSIVWSEDDCNKTPSFTGLSTISGDSLAREVIEKYTQGYGFFIPSYKTIGCSKDFKCKDTFDSNVIDKSMIGKTAVYRGFCIFGEKWKISDEDNIKLHEAERPLPFKYAAIIGVDGPSSSEGSDKEQGSGSGEAPSGKGSGAGSFSKLARKSAKKLRILKTMKLFLAIICIIFSAATSNEIRASGI